MMKATINSKVLASALGVVAKARSTKDLFSESVLLSVKGRSLSVSCRNSEESVSYCKVVPVTTGEDGSVLIDSSLLQKLCSLLGDMRLSLTQKEWYLLAEWKGGRSVMPLTDMKDYDDPVVAGFKEEGARSLVMESKTLADAINAVSYCMSNDDTRPFVCGIFINAGEDSLDIVSTNLQALHLRRLTDFKFKEEERFSFILPRGKVAIVSSILGDGDSVEITCSDSSAWGMVRIRCGASVVYLMGEKGKYPNYYSIVPKAEDTDKLVVLPREFTKVVKRVVEFSCKESRHILLKFQPFSVQLGSADLSSDTACTESFPISSDMAMQDFSIALKGSLFSSVAEHLGDSFVLRMKTSRSSILVTSAEEQEGYEDICIVMPVMASSIATPEDLLKKSKDKEETGAEKVEDTDTKEEETDEVQEETDEVQEETDEVQEETDEVQEETEDKEEETSEEVENG